MSGGTAARRVVVSGGAGFIGSHTVEALVARGWRVLVVDDLSHACGAELPGEVEVLAADAGSEEAASALWRFAPDAALHLAARGGVALALGDPRGYVARSVASSVGFFAGACAAGARVLVTASTGGALYGEADVLPTPETVSPAPRSPYGASKQAEEGYLDCFGRMHAISTVALRYGNVYGPRQDGSGEAGVVAITAQRLVDSQVPRIHGDGRQTRDFVYVADVAAANVAALAGAPARAINIGTGREASVLEVVRTLVDASGDGVAPELLPARPGEVRRSCLDVGRAAQSLNWRAQTTLTDGLSATYAWFATHRLRQQITGGV
ncbi:MAG TPA: NAD-dependent epimerase/dehydratase family protein [Candidatus Dormibacteraeota bacterium]